MAILKESLELFSKIDRIPFAYNLYYREKNKAPWRLFASEPLKSDLLNSVNDTSDIAFDDKDDNEIGLKRV